jgi:hypothetical protein
MVLALLATGAGIGLPPVPAHNSSKPARRNSTRILIDTDRLTCYIEHDELVQFIMPL